MKLSRLLSSVSGAFGAPDEDPEIEGLSEDSRTVGRNFLFFARPGTKASGLDHAAEAAVRGAAAVLSEEPVRGVSVPVVRVPSMQKAQAAIAETFYDFPSRDLSIVGITGTNGKTTVTYLLESIARAAGWRAGVIGTINYRLPAEGDSMDVLAAPNTTPNALELQKLLHAFRDRKTDLVIMEVSSHALALGRVEGVEFDAAVFTNLTQDHLDFHKTMENYFEAKSALFRGLKPGAKAKRGDASQFRLDKFCIINSDDPYGEKMRRAACVPARGYALESRAEFTASDVVLSPSGTRFVLNAPAGNSPVQLRLLGRHNVYNALAAGACALELGLPLSQTVKGLESLECVPGRLEPVKCGQGFSVLVDYAHTEDALRNVMGILRQFAKKRLLTLFGCGGDRDRSKRPLMGATAVQMSDWVVVTSDNPRFEDPRGIILDIEVGIHRSGKHNYEVLLDREKAIEKILKLAEKDDIVLLAGKGHETYQIFSDRTVHFDDREVARKFLGA